MDMSMLLLKLNSLMQLLTEETCLLEVTVPTGLESVAVEEIIANMEIDKLQICQAQGRVYFIINIATFDKVRRLRSVDNVSLLADVITGLKFTGDEAKDMEVLKLLALNLKILKAVEQWALISKYEGNIKPPYEEFLLAKKRQSCYVHLKKLKQDCDIDEVKHNVLKFRITCDRTGDHSFTSTDAATVVGGNISDMYHWVVSLCNWDLNMLLRICRSNAIILMKLTPQSLHRRQIVAFGSMTLRPTIAYGMLALAKLQPGDHMIDPMCGSGSIPIECMNAFPQVTVSCGDISMRAIEKSLANLNVQCPVPTKPMLFQWSASRLPYQRHTIDAIVTDLPFGKRSGSKGKNFFLYKKVVDEFARVIKYDTGRIVLLTKDSYHLLQAMGYKKGHSFWNIIDIRKVNVGALKCTLITAKLGNWLEINI